MTYSIRQATVTDIPHIVSQRERMFREMAIAADFAAMQDACGRWLHQAIPSHTYLGWIAAAGNGEVAGGGGLIVIPWPPGPITMDPRCGFVFNVYTEPSHRKRGVARQLMDVMHERCRAEGIERVVLNASASGHPLYESMGYVVSEQPMMRLRV
jgi:GNAT superfamily N-acetyltransferase